ncbi:MAG: hypothetical protein LBB89_06475 [Treponema sp.]|jgi:hypothetical protein|nr:hypothetical protein [Treponema sp.]
MKIGEKRPIPKYIKKKLPGGIERLNTINCRYYGIIGLSRKIKDWYEGMFMEWIFNRYEADYILDLKEGVWWCTGRNNTELATRLERETA